MSGRPFLKEFVKTERSPSGELRTGNAVRNRLFLILVGDLWGRCYLNRSGCRRGGKLRSFFSRAIAPNTFLREVPLTGPVGGSAGSWQMLIYLLRIPLRTATPFRVTCDRLRPLYASQSPHPGSRLELARTGGISSDG